MGPRSEERGIPLRHLVGVGVAGASMGPRSEERGILTDARTCPPLMELQWGRVQRNAESVQQKTGEIRDRMLQWGRVQRNAESAKRSACFQTPTRRLQWGRVQRNAESAVARES